MKRIIHFFTRLCEAYLPDAFVFCLILTLIIFGCALALTPHSPLELTSFWGKDFWSLNAFAMQMVFVLISGHMLATTPFIRSLLRLLITPVQKERVALVLISCFSVIACWINWGFGLIVSGVLALELARKLGKVNFGLFIASAYSGFVVWHGGLSGSIPLKIAGKDEVMSRVFPNLSLPLSDTIFSSTNVLLILALLVILPLFTLLMNTDEKVEVLAPREADIIESKVSNLRDSLETTPFLNLIFLGLFLVVMIQGFLKGEPFDINRVNFIFLFLALAMHQTPRRFLRALQDSIGLASGIVIQFPFYAGLMGLMQYSGLADIISQQFVEISTSQTLPLWTFFSGGLVNFFVPSGGGQWVVQGPIVLKAAKDIGVDPAKVSMALAWGDAWTNLIQPFWVLPLLAMAKLQLKDIMGYCLIYLLVSGVIISGFLLFL